MRALLPTILLFTMANCASQHLAAVPVAATSLAAVGCYQVSITPWKPPIPAGSDPTYFQPPPYLELTDEAEPNEQGWYVARPALGTTAGIHVMDWQPTDRGATVVISTGFAGLRMSLDSTDANLVAEAHTMSCAGPDGVAAVRLSRVAC